MAETFPAPLGPAWVVVPNQNGLRWLPDLCRTLAATLPPGVVTLVVDNGSADGSLEYLATDWPDVRVLPLDRSLGFVQATNLGILAARRAGARGVVLLNNDVRCHAGWFDRLEEAAADAPEVGVLGAWQFSYDGKPSPRTAAIVQGWRKRVKVGPGAPLPAVMDTDWCEGSCLYVKARVFDRVGMLDPLFAPAYFEEIDLCRRARAAGEGVALVPESRIDHHGAGTSLDGPAKARQRTLLERNYLLFHWSDPRLAAPLGPVRAAALLAKRGIKAVLGRKATPAEWRAAAAQAVSRWPAAAAKARRDRDGAACPVMGTKVRLDDAARYFADVAHEPLPAVQRSRPAVRLAA